MWALSAAETQSAGGARRQRRKLTGCLANKGKELIFNSKLWIPKSSLAEITFPPADFF